MVRPGSPVVQTLKAAKFEVIEIDSVAEGDKMIRAGTARLVLDFPKVTEPAKAVEIDAFFDKKEQQGQIAFAKVQAVLGELNKASLLAFLKAHNLPAEAQEPIKLVRKEILVGSKDSAGELLVGLLPYVIVMWAFYGGMSIAGDLVAGEKDKTTLETLLITPVSRNQIVLGKFLALTSICLMSSFSTALGLAVVGIVRPPGSEEILKNGAGVSPAAFVLIVLLMIPTAALFASALIAVSSYAKNPREAQTYMTSLSFLVVFPGMFSQFIGLTDYGTKMWINFIPILNTANNLRNVLLGKAEFVPLLITVIISTVLASLALLRTVTLVNREEVLVRV